MSNDSTLTIVRALLDRLETAEAKLLTWGVVDGGFTREEVEEHASRVIDEGRPGALDADALIEELHERRLIVDLNVGGVRVYRTRMAEAVRLFARLRQLFPKRDWASSPTLVADFRFALRPRRYPKRHFKSAAVLEQLGREVSLGPVRRTAIGALLEAGDRGSLELSDFQVRATSTILRDLGSGQSRGMIVAAGTGTGKTLAFYLPALAHVANLVEAKSHWTKVLALYPRNELLKDQFSEAYREARRLDSSLERKRKIVIGAFFGQTPSRATIEEIRKHEEWTNTTQGDGFVCPYLRCPRCEGDVVWRTADIQKSVERLVCPVSTCRAVIESDEVALTRRRMVDEPPDFLFTTTEMLNREIADLGRRHVFGLGPRARGNRPQILLLDEAHTYSGVHGAQVANLIRRYRHALGTPLQITGLSATLREAAAFFAALTGLPAAAVVEVTPEEDLEEEGMEYLLALRGDPVSQASLLSTSIQALMLLGRILDPPQGGRSQGFYGTRVFAFTDDLDVTNRLFHDFLDAEARDSKGRPIAGRSPLASLRSRTAPRNAERLGAGQSWHLCEEVGHDDGLQTPLRVARTSSQDPGVDRDAQVIVATASLEVGFNDPEVGGVLQHKAPIESAAFIQRRGRAGRRRTMRPWTLVTLSDYGRDRLAYQGYELLFSPILSPQSLPVSNRYVLRMQAVFAFIDWVATQVPQDVPEGNIYYDFSAPADTSYGDSSTRRQKWEEGLVRGVLEDPGQRASLERYIKSALQLSTDDELTAVLWEPPRALLRVVLPTLLRRLETGWARVVRPGEGGRDGDYRVPLSPLPDFVPPNLFSDLNLPEVEIAPAVRFGDSREWRMPILQALRTFAPGRVTRRFGIAHRAESHWIAPLDLAATTQDYPVERFSSDLEELGNFQYSVNGLPVDIRCVRPRRISPALPPGSIKTSSNSFLEWRTQIVASDEGDALDLPLGSPWSKVLSEARCYLQNHRTHVEVRRFATGARASVGFRRKGAPDLETRIRFVGGEDGHGSGPAAIGFTQPVDGLAFHFRVPPGFSVGSTDSNPGKVRALRTAYFRHRVLSDPGLGAAANSFQLDWLQQIYLSALASHALEAGASLLEARSAIHAKGVGPAMAETLDVIFQSLAAEEPDDEAQDGSGTGDSSATGDRHMLQPVHERLLALFNDQSVSNTLEALAAVLWEEPDAGWQPWIEQRLRATLGSALLLACQRLCPQSSADDLLLDIDPGPAWQGVRGDEIWITESTLGGTGVVEEVARHYSADPRRFYDFARSALDPGDFEVIDVELRRILRLATSDEETIARFDAVRGAGSHAELLAATEALRTHLHTRGILLTHAVVAALFARVLRPGSSASTDELLHSLVTRWSSEEERLGIELDVRIYAYVASADEGIETVLAPVIGSAEVGRHWRYGVLSGLLWPRGNLVRARSLASRNPFAEVPEGDRDLLLDLIRPAENVIALADPSWRTRVAEAFGAGASVTLVAAPDQEGALKRALLELATEPLEVGVLHLHPKVDGLSREAGGTAARLRVSEWVQ